MEITGIKLALLDIPAELTEEYNRWYDLDHLPEHVSKGDVVAGRRYVADRALRAAPGIRSDDLTGGHPPYATIYSFGGPVDFESEQAHGFWTAKDHGIIRSGRYWKEGTGRYTADWRLSDARARPGVLVSSEAVPHLAHRGILVALGRASTLEQRQDAVEWWTGTHLVDLFTIDGVLAAMRFDPTGRTEPDQILHVILCDDAPGEVMERFEQSMRYQRAVGRFPAHKGVYEPIALLAYELILPLRYDFDIGS